MAEWALGWPDRSHGGFCQPYPLYRPPMPQQHFESQAQPYAPKPAQLPAGFPEAMQRDDSPVPKGDNPREIRNKAEKQRRDKLNQSIAELAVMVPPVAAASRKIDKTGVLRLTAHFLRSHQYVFGETIGRAPQEFNNASVQALLQFLNGFLLTTTYKGIVVVVSQNVQEYLGYTELDLLGQNIFTITHKDDHKILRDNLMPRSQALGPNGELLIPDQPDGKELVAKALAGEKRHFVVRFKKNTQRSEPMQYVTCHVEGSLRKSDQACRGNSRCCQMVRRARARGDNPCSSGNDVVFIGIVRPACETFKKESQLEQFRMEYRTRHSIDGQIIQCEKRIALVTGYMTEEVEGVNAMNFMHRDDVRWVIIALREMYDQHRLYGESCYRLMMKNGQFIYMRTRGCLEVDKGTKAVTSFVCTNTAMNDTEGQHLVKMMKKKFTLLVNHDEPPREPEITDPNDDSFPVEDPRQLEKVILHLVTNLPSPQPDERGSPDQAAPHLAIIPPRKERIVSAIEKIYSVIKTFNNPKRRPQVDTPKTTLPKISTIAKYRHSNLGDYVFPESNTFSEYISLQPNIQSKFNFTKTQIVDLDEPGPSAVTGMKRPNEYQIEDGNFKKKIVINEDSDEQSNNRSSPTLENFFNEAILSSQFGQIDAALNSLENNIDPSFPDLLISQDVQDFFGELEYDPEKSADLQKENE